MRKVKESTIDPFRGEYDSGSLYIIARSLLFEQEQQDQRDIYKQQRRIQWMVKQMDGCCSAPELDYCPA